MPKPTTPPKETATTKYGTRILQLASKCEGRDVWELQIKLLGWGSGSDRDTIGRPLDPVRVTGTFDITTRDAVRRFQQAHKLPVTGVVDDAVFRAIDLEAALHPVLVHQLRCPCPSFTDDQTLCRCEKHPEAGRCTGFGKGRFKGKYLTEGKKADGADISGEKLDLYDMTELDGVDKALLWAMRGLMHRAEIKELAVVAGYRCWQDNYRTTDEQRWRHRRSTFHLGKAIEFYHAGTCTEWGQNRTANPCVECARIRTIALEKCGFQLRFQEPDRVSVGEGTADARPPTTPFAVHINTVRRIGRCDEDVVKTHLDGVKPLFSGLAAYSYPLELGDGLDPRSGPSATFFDHAANRDHGWYPYGLSRTWHGGIHLFPGREKEVHALAGGEIVACRVGEAENAKTFGSRNFVLVRHLWKTKPWYSLYMHLDAEAALGGWCEMLLLRSPLHPCMVRQYRLSRPRRSAATPAGSRTGTSFPARRIGLLATNPFTPAT